MFGVVDANELKLKRSTHMKNRQVSDETKLKLSNRIQSDEWKLKNSLSKKGRKRINNGFERKMVSANDLDFYLTSGWSLGWKL